MEPITSSAAPTLDALESRLVELEALIAACRSEQLDLLGALEAECVAALDGARTFTEWTAARLDVTPTTAKDLVNASRTVVDRPEVASELATGVVSFDRAAATLALAAAGADDATLADSRGLDLTGVARLTARHRRVSAGQERQRFTDRYLTMQPSLDLSHWRLHGRLGGLDGELVARAVTVRGDQLHTHDPAVAPATRPQRAADALVSMAQDSLDPPHPNDTTTDHGGRAPLVSVFVDAALAAASGGEAGAATTSGVRVGPATLHRLLCDATVEITTTGATPLGIGTASRSVPPRLRRFVLHRDGGCCVDGCQSRYRLQPHHLTPAAAGGATDPDNLATLCWYHHHIVIHGRGYRIDPTSPPQRLRFHRPDPRSPP